MKKLFIVLGVFFILTSISAYLTYKYMVASLPQIMNVNDYKPLLVSNVYDRNQKKIGEFFRERRILVPFKEIPRDLVNAFLAAEDDSFFQHKGLNYIAILRASLANLKAGKKVQGGSTITQQVARTFFLSNEKTLLRKVKEALLALKMEENLSKEDILYLYLNQIFFGQGAYGIGAAAEVYFRKTVQELNLSEMAILAGLPKAPSDYTPVRNPVRAKERQVYVLHRMAEVGFIKEDIAQKFIQQPVKVYLRENYMAFAPFFLETVKQALISQLGEEMVLDKGLRIHTGLDLKKQLEAQEAMVMGLKQLDKRQGYRGPLKNMTAPKEVGEFLMKSRNTLITEAVPEKTIQVDGHFVDNGPLNLNYDVKKLGLPFYLKLGKTGEAIVSKVDDQLGLVFVKMAEVEGLIDIETMRWARKPKAEMRYDLDTIKKPSEALKMGDVVLVKVAAEKFTSQRLSRILAMSKGKLSVDTSKHIALELDQEPLAQSAVLSLDQQTEEIIAMIGGYNFETSKYNRALQAARQTGSAFKAIVYASALEKGYTAATPIMDAPIVYEESRSGEKGTAKHGANSVMANSGRDEDLEGQEDVRVWKPTNHSKSFGGDIIFRNALVRSLNVPTVKIIEELGVNWASDFAKRIGIFSPLNMDFTLALGSSSITLYEMTKVFSQFGRMGKRIRPVLVHKVDDYTGKKILDKINLDVRFEKETAETEKKFEERRANYLQSLKALDPVQIKELEKSKTNLDPHIFFQDPDQLMRPQTAYITTGLLKAVVEDPFGTGGRARSLGREVAGKTGTTNGYYDAWFIGFTPQIATGVWVGFDQEKTLGKGEVGGRAALPIWLDYMKAAHEGLPQMTFPVPEGIVFANIDGETGDLATASTKKVIRQAFFEGTEPTGARNQKQEESDFYKQDLTE